MTTNTVPEGVKAAFDLAYPIPAYLRFDARQNRYVPAANAMTQENLEISGIYTMRWQTWQKCSELQRQRNEGEAVPYGIIDADYARIYTKARCTAWNYGWAVLMQGSFTRDLDLLFVPWTEKASSDHEHLIRLICDWCDLQPNGHPPTKKPHGRTAYTLLFKDAKDPRFIDISFMPKADTSPPAAEHPTDVKRLEEDAERWRELQSNTKFIVYYWSGSNSVPAKPIDYKSTQHLIDGAIASRKAALSQEAE